MLYAKSVIKKYSMLKSLELTHVYSLIDICVFLYIFIFIHPLQHFKKMSFNPTPKSLSTAIAIFQI